MCMRHICPQNQFLPFQTLPTIVETKELPKEVTDKTVDLHKVGLVHRITSKKIGEKVSTVEMEQI